MTSRRRDREAARKRCGAAEGTGPTGGRLLKQPATETLGSPEAQRGRTRIDVPGVQRIGLESVRRARWQDVAEAAACQRTSLNFSVVLRRGILMAWLARA